MLPLEHVRVATDAQFNELRQLALPLEHVRVATAELERMTQAGELQVTA